MMHRRWSIRRLLAIRVRAALLLAAFTALSYANAVEAVDGDPAAPSPSSGLYRRVFVPADSPEQWPTNGAPYLPVDRAEFERLTATAEEAHQLKTAGAAHVASAVYEAKFAGDGSLMGTARLEVKTADRAPRILPLTSNLAIAKAQWLNGESEPEKAMLGVWNATDGKQGAYGVLAARPGTLELTWQSAAKDPTSSPTEFELRLPPAISQEFSVELPTGYSATVSPSIPVTNAAAQDSAKHRWTFKLIPALIHRLVIHRPPTAPADSASLPLVAVNHSYEIGPAGVDVEAEFRVQPRRSGPLELRVPIPESLQINEVRVGQETLSLLAHESAAKELVIPLPAEASPTTVTIRAAGAVLLDAPWTPPSFSPRGCFWTEGAMVLRVDPAMELRRLAPRGSILVNVVGVGQPDAGEVYRLQLSQPDASADLLVSKRTAVLHSVSGVTAEFAERELIGEGHAKLWAEGGRIFHIAASVQPGWNIESLDALPADDVVEWHMSDDAAEPQLHLQLRRSPTVEVPLQLKLTARKRLSRISRAAKLRELDWFELPGASHASTLFVKDLHGGTLVPSAKAAGDVAEANSLDADQRSLWDDVSEGLVFIRQSLDHEATVRVASTLPRFQAEAWIELVKNPTGFQHSAVILCRPIQGALDEVVVRLARPLPPEAEWSIGDNEEQLVVQPILPAQADGEALAAAGNGAVDYRVHLAKPHSGQFSLHVSWRGGDGKSDSVNTLVVRGAEAWQAWGILRGDADSADVDPHGFSPAALGRQKPTDALPMVLGTYRLGDDAGATPVTGPSLRVGGATLSRLHRGVVCRKLAVTTVQFADGNRLHRVRYELDVSGDQVVEFTIPRSLELTSARINGAPAILETVSTQPGRVRVTLPTNERTVFLVVDAREKSSPLGYTAILAPRLPAASFPLMRGFWSIAVPPQYELIESNESSVRLGVLERLFGPLARNSATAGMPYSAAVHAATLESDPAAHDSNDRAAEFLAPSGWQISSQDFITAPSPVQVRLISAAKAAWYVAGLVSAVAAAMVLRRHRRPVVAGVSLLAVVCLLVPTAWLAVPQGLLLGALAGVLIHTLMLLGAPSAKSDRRTAAVIASIVVFFLQGNTAYATDKNHSPPAVFFPLDDRAQAAGTDVYAPAPLLSKLLMAAEPSRHDGASSVLLSSSLQLDLERNASGECIVSECSLRLVWQTFQREVQVELPLVKNDAEWINKRHRLNGQPTALNWSSSGRTCSLQLASPGRHELEIHLLPKVATAAGTSRLSLHVPPLSGATVEVNHPPGVPIALPAATIIGDPTRTTATLPPNEKADVSWPARALATASSVGVAQLSWLQINPASSTLEARFQTTGDARALTGMRLAVAPHLKMLPLPEASSIQVAQVMPGAPQIVEVQFRAVPQLPTTLSLMFEVQRRSSMGRMDFPLVRVLDVEATSHDFVVSANERLAVREESAAELTPVSTADLEQRWGAQVTPTRLRYAVSSPSSNWSATVEPAPPRFSAAESLDLSFTANVADVMYTADVTDITGELLVHRVKVPRGVQLESASASLQGEQTALPLRWSWSNSDEVTVFLSRPLTEPHSLRLDGHLPYQTNESVPIPRIALAASTASPQSLRVRRSSDVIVDWAPGATPPDPAATRAKFASQDGALLVGEYLLAPNDDGGLALSVTENAPEFEADMLLTVNEQRSAATVACIVQGKVTEGILDHLKIETDKGWSGPFSVEPDAGLSVGSTPDVEGRQTLEISLAEPVPAGESFLLRIESPLTLIGNQPVRFPRIRIAARSRRTFIALPLARNGNAAEWVHRGLTPALLPKTFAASLGSTVPGQVYRADRERFVVEQRRFSTTLRQASVRMALTRLSVDESGDWSAISHLVIQPGENNDLTIEPPTGAELVHMEIDGQPVSDPIVVGPRWRLPAGPRYLPRLVTIEFRKQQQASASDAYFSVPSVLSAEKRLPLIRALWQVEAEAPLRLTATQAAAITPQALKDVSRTATIRAAIDASPLVFQLHPWEARQWCEPWLALLGEATANADRSTSKEERAWREFVQRLKSVAAQLPPELMPPPANVQDDLNLGVSGQCFTGDANGGLALVFQKSTWQPIRFLAALAIVGAWGLAWRYPVQRQAVFNAANSRRHLLIAIAGIIWWVAFKPSLLGPAIIALDLAAFFKQRSLTRHRELPQRLEPLRDNTAIGGA